MDFGVIILAIIQGIAEFLPISSSAHLIIFRDLFGIGASMFSSTAGNVSDFALAFDIALHFGTLLAILLYFFKDFWKMLINGFSKNKRNTYEGRMLWYIVASTIPAAVVGLLLEEKIEEYIRGNFIIIAVCLIVMGILIFLSDKYSKSDKDMDKITLSDALTIGCSQVFALIPGFSRSGTTIAMSRFLNINKEDAAKFSFYLSAPVVGGAVVLSLLDSSTYSLILANLGVFITGIVVSFISGLLCIKFLLKYLKSHDFKIFMWYRVILGIIVIIYTLVR